MNPFCKEHNPPVLMLAKRRSYTFGKVVRTGRMRKVYVRVWECPRCKKRIRR